MLDAKEKAIRNLGLFRECSPQDVRWIAQNADQIHVPAGRKLGLDGVPAREFIVVMDGVVRASDDFGEVLLGPGASAGAAELLQGRSRKATLSTGTDARLLVFGAREFRTLINRVPDVATRLAPVVRPVQTELSLRAVS